MKTLVFASHNPNKLEEIRQLLPAGITLLSLDDIGCREEIPETADTLEGNARLKAAWVRERYGYDCFADDTGLEVDALGGAPGVFSARFAGPGGDSQANVEKLLGLLRRREDRNACFRTVIALALGEDFHYFEGRVCGHILTEARGTGGFGYDPVFQPEGHTESFAEMSLKTKNRISHRGKALQKLDAFLREILPA